MQRKLMILILSILALAGCARHHAILSTAVAPGQTPTRADPIYLATPEHPSIAEMKAEQDLRTELCRQGFTLVENPARARWHLGYRVETATNPADKQLTYDHGRALLLGPMAAVQSSDPIARTVEALHLYSPGPDGVPIPVWEGTARVTEKEALVYGPVPVRLLLTQFGKNFSGAENMRRPDPEEAAQPCVPPGR